MPDTAPLAFGFELARVHAARGRAVRVIGFGATYPDAWPPWAAGEPLLSVAEPGGYELGTRMAASRPIANELRAWCDRVFAGVVPGARGSELLYGAVGGRLMQGVEDAVALVDGLRALHPRAELIVTDPRWHGNVLLLPPRTLSDPERALIAILALAGILASVAAFAREHVRGRAVRARIGAQSASFDAPRLWLGLVPDWGRANKHLVTTLGMAALERGERIGVLLLHNFGARPRQRAEGAGMWVGLGPLRDHAGDRVHVEQAVMPSEPARFAAALGRAVLGACRATVQVLAAGPPPFAPTGAMPARRVSLELGKLVSRDVMSAVLAFEAGAELVRSGALPAGAHVVFCAANLPGFAGAERALAHGGVRTAEYMHGAGNNQWQAAPESSVALRFVWTETDAESLAPTGQRTEAAGLPVPDVERAPGTGPIRILLLTNYLHEELIAGGRGTQRAAYLREILAVPDLLRRTLPARDLAFRWRPHPSEHRALVEASARRLHDVELSRAPPFEEDLSWAEIVVTTHSSTALEALFAERPVFVHVRPELDGTPITAYALEGRAYRKAREIIPHLAQCVESIRDDPARALDIEARAKRAAVGPSGAPRPLLQAVREWMGEEP